MRQARVLTRDEWHGLAWVALTFALGVLGGGVGTWLLLRLAGY